MKDSVEVSESVMTEGNVKAENFNRPSFGNQILNENIKLEENKRPVEKLFYKINNLIIKPKNFGSTKLSEHLGKIIYNNYNLFR